MRCLEKISLFCSKVKLKQKGLLIILGTALVAMSGCGSDSGGSSSGYLKFYNAASNSPAVFINIDGTDNFSGNGFDFGEAVSYELEQDGYELQLAWEEDDFDFGVFYGGDDKDNLFIKDERNSLIVLASISSDNVPDIVTYDYKDIRDDLTDDEDDEELAMRFINLYQDDVGIKVYYALKDEGFDDAKLFSDTSIDYKVMTESILLESSETYKFYITSADSDDVLYESDEQYFAYRSQYIMFVKANTGPGESPYTIDKMYTSGAIDEYPDVIDPAAEIRFYNGIIGDDLLPTYVDSVDLKLNGTLGDVTSVDGISRQAFSAILSGDRGDFTMDVYPSGEADPISENSYLNLDANDDDTVFLFTTIIEEEDDRDPDTIEKREAFISALTVANSSTVSTIEHKITIINLIDDHSILRVSFAKDEETAATAPNFVNSARATPSSFPNSLNLSNDIYTVQVIFFEEDGSAKTLASTEITLDENSQDMFLIIEGNKIDNQEPSDVSEEVPYTITFVEQNNN